MVFCSSVFLFLFLPLCLCIYYLAPAKFRNVVLLSFSIPFYAWGETMFLWLLFVSIGMNYGLGIWVEKSSNPKPVLIAGVILNLLPLLFHKYLNFLLTSIHITIPEGWISTVLPLGISFYTFHSISYLTDIYRKKGRAQKNVFKMGLYIVNFSQLVAGPIIRYHDVADQLNHRNHTWNRFSNGLILFITGLARKILLANILGQMADALFATNPAAVSPVQAWIGMLAYTLQIYFDFSGYSEMALGLGRMFGFEFRANFNFPYIAQSIREFWRRWHISLSTWFRDYVYIPLGGNQYSNARTAFNLVLIFVLCGFWHGAKNTFLVWGLYHGFWLVLERGWWGRLLKKVPRLLRIAYTWIIVCMGWVFFRSDDLGQASALLKKMCFLNFPEHLSPDLISNLHPYFYFIFCIALLFSLKLPYHLYMAWFRKNREHTSLIRTGGYVALILLFLLCISDIVSGSYNPFIYYRF